MKQLIIVFMLLAMGLPNAFAGDIADNADNRQAAAKRYLGVAPIENMMREAVESTSRNLPEEQRKTFVEFMTKSLKIDVLEKSVVSTMANHFTVGELNALTDFYGSPEGKSAMKKFGAYMSEIMPVIQQEMSRAALEYKATQENSAGYTIMTSNRSISVCRISQADSKTFDCEAFVGYFCVIYLGNIAYNQLYREALWQTDVKAKQWKLFVGSREFLLVLQCY